MSPSHPGITIRPGHAGDLDDIVALMSGAYHESFDDDDRSLERAISEPERSLMAIGEDGQAVGHVGAFRRELTVPGGVVPAAHVTQVAVAPTHRRRGALTRMMHRQLREQHEAGREPVSVLWASEGKIYPRYGFGLAAARLALQARTVELRLPETPVPGRLRMGTIEALRPALREVFEAVRPHRPGWSGRNDAWWDYVLADTPAHRQGGTPLRLVVHDGPDGPDGYALWRVRESGNPGRMEAVVHVKEMVATTPAVQLVLWRFLFGIDLTRAVHHSFVPLDEPLVHLVDDPGWLGARWEHCLWARLVDVPAALAARRYAVTVDVVLEVTDPVLPANAGRWRLRGDGEKAVCERTDAPADLSCDVRDLGAAYLGGTSLGALAGAGRVAERTAGALSVASAAFGWHRAPVAIEVF